MKIHEEAPFYGPHHLEAVRRGPAAEEELLTSWLRRVESEGDDEDRYLALYEGFQLFARQKRKDGVIEYARKLLDLTPPDPQICRLVGIALVRDFGEPELAIEFVKSGQKVDSQQPNSIQLSSETVRLLKLELASLSKLQGMDVLKTKVAGHLSLVISLVSGWDELLVETLESLSHSGLLMPAHLPLLEFTWADLSRLAKFHGQNHIDSLERIEAIIRNVTAVQA